MLQPHRQDKKLNNTVYLVTKLMINKTKTKKKQNKNGHKWLVNLVISNGMQLHYNPPGISATRY